MIAIVLEKVREGVGRARGKKEGAKEYTSIIKHTVQALGEHRPRAGDV